MRELRLELKGHPVATTPLFFEPGEEAQFDWGDVYLRIAGHEVKGNLFVGVLCHSLRTFARVFPHSNQESFLEGHLAAFETWNGCAARWAYDNLTSAEKRVLIGGDREENPLFQRFRSYYGADARYCTPGIEGAHEKGRVERRVGLTRTAAFVPVPDCATWEAANIYLAEQNDKLAANPHPDYPEESIADVFEREQAT